MRSRAEMELEKINRCQCQYQQQRALKKKKKEGKDIQTKSLRETRLYTCSAAPDALDYMGPGRNSETNEIIVPE
jgi:hypothetical protein